ncbi:MAG TPA: HAMP domain-containing sensor histidine kinase [Verrucomicrobiae bacterium]|nr:HAMP domain-containing sensor histidine kinase [Verrucomicrobiae bacterium]
MTGLVAAAGIVVAAPLVAAVLIAGVVLERLTLDAERLVDKGVSLANLAARLQDDLNGLERSARQFIILDDAGLLDVFFARVTQMQETLQEIEKGGFDQTFAEPVLVLGLRQGLTDAADGFVRGLANGEPLGAAADRIGALKTDVEALTRAGRAAVDADMARLNETSTDARHVMWISSVALIPLTAALAFGFSVIVTRPLRKMAGAIATLGHAQYDKPVSIAYPVEMERLGEQLDWLRRRLAQFEEDKDRFLRLVSHELKTPLSSLHEGAALLAEGALGSLTPQQTEVAQILVESSLELSDQIDKLLTFAEWREGHRKVNQSWFDIEPLVAEVLEAQKLPMSNRDLTATVNLAAPRLFGQRYRVRVALENLVSNAIKHAPAGSAIEIRVGQTGNRCELSVRDSGRGVSRQERERIFEPFVRGTEAEESNVRGTGVGLSIVKEAVLAHGGKVAVEDAHPGARFKLVWPCPQTQAAPHA